jgi:hypothetical protein
MMPQLTVMAFSEGSAHTPRSGKMSAVSLRFGEIDFSDGRILRVIYE